MRESVLDSVTRLLRYQRAPEKATAIFQSWKHNSHILPRLQTQLEMLLRAYGKFQPVVYDTQGFKDDGADIILRCRPVGTDEEPELIGFQVKSFLDLSAKDHMKDLKSQRDDSFRKVTGLTYYFIVLCTDAVAHRERMRTITAEFRSADRTEIIEPAYAFTFLHHPERRVEALVTRTMEAEDKVLNMALHDIEYESPSARALMLFMAVKFAFTGGSAFCTSDLISEPILRKAYSTLRAQQSALLDDYIVRKSRRKEGIKSHASGSRKYGVGEFEEPIQIADIEEQLAQDLEVIGSDVEIDPESDRVVLQLDQIRPLIAVVMDAVARYDYDESEAIEYMFNLMDVGF